MAVQPLTLVCLAEYNPFTTDAACVRIGQKKVKRTEFKAEPSALQTLTVWKRGCGMVKRPTIVLSVHYCPKCGGELTSRSYNEWLVASYETCDCPSCGLTWRVARYQNGQVRVAEIPRDEGSPEEFERTCG